MDERSLLGPADVTDERLTRMVVQLLGTDPAVTRVLGSCAERVDYDLPSITTAGRYWVQGTADVAGQELPFAFFVKHVESWSRSPLFQLVPEELRPLAAAGVPWRTEALAYRSDLADRLPDGLRMPRCLGVFDLDDLSASLWLEVVETASVEWDLGRYRHAAHLLGRLAGSPRIAALGDVGRFGWNVGTYLAGRLGGQVLPMLRDERLWQHPLVVAAFEPALRTRLLAAADSAPELVSELQSLPTLVAHGDACPNNLLMPKVGSGFVLIDYGFWSPSPVGFDLSQLLVGDVQVGRRASDDLHDLEETIVPAYVEGLRAEGCEIPEAVVRRAHALQLMIFTGLSTLPWEHLDSEPTPELHQVAAERAALARFSLDLLERTS